MLGGVVGFGWVIFECVRGLLLVWCDIVVFPSVELRYTWCLSKCLLLCLHLEMSSLRLFSSFVLSLNVNIANFSERHKLQLLFTLLYPDVDLSIFHLILNDLLDSFSCQMCFESAVSFI